METIKEIFRIGHGPSSSHTMGPKYAAEKFIKYYPDAVQFQVILHGSLAATGRGHLSDLALYDALGKEKTEIIWRPDEYLDYHPNALTLIAFDGQKKKIGEKTYYSVGGGKISEGGKDIEFQSMYKLTTMEDIIAYCQKMGMALWEYVVENEGVEIMDYIAELWDIMKDSIHRGIEKEGVLPGGLGLSRKASAYFVKASGYKLSLKKRTLLFAYAMAVGEENASGGKIVTAPTCGSAGVLPASLYLVDNFYEFSDIKIHRAIATAGLIGNLVKCNASISGAEVGCQGEIGTACAMASGALSQLFGGTPQQVEYAAEMGLEHHLGLTCDPVQGLVQIPCIERNAFAAARALDANVFAMNSDGKHRIPFDKVVRVMNQTGKDLPCIYRETSLGGLAKGD
jgi:L-serine dehydratase